MATKPNTKVVNPAKSNVALVNAMRNYMSADYRKTIDIAESFDDVRSIGNIVMSYPGFANEFLDTLVNKVVDVYVMSKMYKNPWAMFKKGEISLGETVELVFNDIIKARQYDIDKAENEVFKRGDANARTSYASINSKVFYKAVVEPNQLAHAFVTEGGFYQLIENITAQLVNSREQDEFMAMKYLVGLHCLNGHFKVVEIPEVSKTNMADIATQIMAVSDAIEFPSTGVDYNYAGVHTFATKDEQYLIASSIFNATMDVNLLASAFNMEKAEFMGHRVKVDSFGTIDVGRLDALFDGVPGYTRPDEETLKALDALPAVLIDKDWFFVLEQRLSQGVDSLQNPEGMYRNYWRHVWMAYQANPFAIAVAFVPGTPTVNSVTVSPTKVTVDKGQTAQLSVTVDTANFASKDVTFESDNDKVKVDYRGRIYVLPDAGDGITANITVKSTADPSKTGTCVVSTPAAV